MSTMQKSTGPLAEHPQNPPTCPSWIRRPRFLSDVFAKCKPFHSCCVGLLVFEKKSVRFSVPQRDEADGLDAL